MTSLTPCKHGRGICKECVLKKCPDCLAHYTGKHECDGLMKHLVTYSKMKQKALDTYEKKKKPSEVFEAGMKKQLEWDSQKIKTDGVYEPHQPNPHAEETFNHPLVIRRQGFLEALRMVEEGLPKRMKWITENNALERLQIADGYNQYNTEIKSLLLKLRQEK